MLEFELAATLRDQIIQLRGEKKYKGQSPFDPARFRPLELTRFRTWGGFLLVHAKRNQKRAGG